VVQFTRIAAMSLKSPVVGFWMFFALGFRAARERKELKVYAVELSTIMAFQEQTIKQTSKQMEGENITMNRVFDCRQGYPSKASSPSFCMTKTLMMEIDGSLLSL